MNFSNIPISQNTKLLFQHIQNQEFLKIAKIVKNSHFNPFEICPNGLTILESLLFKSNEKYENIILMIIQKFHYSLKKMKHKRFLCFVETDSIINSLLQYDCIEEFDLFDSHHFCIYENNQKTIEMKINFLFAFFLTDSSLETFDQILSIIQDKKRMLAHRKIHIIDLEKQKNILSFINIIDFCFVKMDENESLGLLNIIDKLIFLYFHYPDFRKPIEKYHDEIFHFLTTEKKYLENYTAFEQELYFEKNIHFFLEHFFHSQEIEKIIQHKILQPISLLWEKIFLYFIEKNDFSLYLNPQNQSGNYTLFIHLSYSKIIHTFAKNLDIFEILYWNITKKYETNTLIELKIIKGLLSDFYIFDWDNFYVNYFFSQLPDLFLALKGIKNQNLYCLDNILDPEIKNLTYRYIFHHQMNSSLIEEKKQLKI